MPGVSITRPPPGSSTSWRRVVAWRPRPSARTSRVSRTSSPSKRLTSVDLPTPDEPRSATVLPGCRKGRTASQPPSSIDNTASTSTPKATDCTARSRRPKLSHASAFVSTTTGTAPPSHASAR